MATELSPLNDLAFFAKLQQVSTSTGAKTPLTSGTVTAFLATSNAADATAADASLSVSAVHVTGGKWLVFFDASVLTLTLLETHFASVTPYLIIEQEDGFRVYHELEYSEAKAAT